MRIKTMMACLLAFAIPIAAGHGPVGAPKTHCEDPTEWATHDYVPPASGLVLSGFADGSLDDCDGEGTPGDYDGHSEWSRGGAWILSCEAFCNYNPWTGQYGAGATACFGEAAHHPEHPTVTVHDDVLGYGADFVVGADRENLAGPDPVTGYDCGDFDGDEQVTCVGSCTPTFPAGQDGSYQVYVRGTSGHVCTDACDLSAHHVKVPAAGSITLRSTGTWETTFDPAQWSCSRSGNAVRCVPIAPPPACAGCEWECHAMWMTASPLTPGSSVKGYVECQPGNGIETGDAVFPVQGSRVHGNMGDVDAIVCEARAVLFQSAPTGSWTVMCSEP